MHPASKGAIHIASQRYLRFWKNDSSLLKKQYMENTISDPQESLNEYSKNNPRESLFRKIVHGFLEEGNPFKRLFFLLVFVVSFPAFLAVFVVNYSIIKPYLFIKRAIAITVFFILYVIVQLLKFIKYSIIVVVMVSLMVWAVQKLIEHLSR